MRSVFLKITLFAILGLSLSCQSEYNQDFELALKNDKVVLINSQTRSCTLQIGDPGFTQGNDLNSTYATFGGFSLNWNGKHPLRLEYLEITFRGPGVGGKQTKVIAGTDLAFIWSGSTLLQDVQTGESASSANCNFVVGDIPVADKTKSWDGQGTFLIYGTTASDDGSGVVPVISSVSFSYSFRSPSGN